MIYALVVPMLPCKTFIFVWRDNVGLQSINFSPSDGFCILSIFTSIIFFYEALFIASKSMNKTNFEPTSIL